MSSRGCIRATGGGRSPGFRPAIGPEEVPPPQSVASFADFPRTGKIEWLPGERQMPSREDFPKFARQEAGHSPGFRPAIGPESPPPP